jgi:hypothetical protein
MFYRSYDYCFVVLPRHRPVPLVKTHGLERLLCGQTPGVAKRATPTKEEADSVAGVEAIAVEGKGEISS